MAFKRIVAGGTASGGKGRQMDSSPAMNRTITGGRIAPAAGGPRPGQSIPYRPGKQSASCWRNQGSAATY